MSSKNSPTISNRIFGGCQKFITDFIITPLYTVAIVTILTFAKLFFITLCTWIGFIFGYFGAKIISQELLLGCEHEEVYSTFGIGKKFFVNFNFGKWQFFVIL